MLKNAQYSLLLILVLGKICDALVIPVFIYNYLPDILAGSYNELDLSFSNLEKPDIININIRLDSLDVVPNKYIIVFRETATISEIESHISYMNSILSHIPQENFSKLNTFNLGDVVFGYSIFLPDIKYLNVIKKYSNIIESIETDSIVRQNKIIVQDDSTWGLARISQRERIFPWNNLSYTYQTGNPNNFVNAYVIDTGIQITHKDFEGRATWGKTTIPYNGDEDLNGHGTHCAGIIGSKTYGVSKNVHLIAVKVLDSSGNGEISDVLKGIEFVVNDHEEQMSQNKKLKGSVVNMSMGAGKSYALTKMVNEAVKKGIHFVVAAGNESDDACYGSPADAEEAISVGATTTSDGRAFFSNWGKCVDIFAPGTGIPSTYIGGNNNSTEVMSGTSMSSPHVAGLVAYFLNLQPEPESEFYTFVTPNQLKEKIINFGSTDKLYDPGENSPNVIAYNGGGKDIDHFW
ncbi:serine protease [Maudiozyma exigua]|uniref:Serine protease n=1 Tax=Maudiozyma exigua TaxID=34358 RepID=A0A9P6VTN1_MAUEX|nr:serine protease [Kazachstania exigua]